MKDRRELLAGGVGAVLGAADCTPSSPGYFPNVLVHAHDGRRALFNDDLLAGKTVLIHCLSIATEPVYRSAERLAQVQSFLGDRLGRDVFFYSLTVDPENDTPRALKAFAERIGVGPGWLLLTGAPADMELLRSRLYVSPQMSHHHAGEDCSMGLARYGNAATGLWGSVPAQANPEWIARRLSWVQPREQPSGPPRRRGPGPLAVGILLALLAALPGLAQEQPPQPDPGWNYLPCPYAGSPGYPGVPGICHPYPQPRPQPSKATTTGCPGDCVTKVVTGEGIFPPSNPFNYKTFPGTNFLPTIYTNMFDGTGLEMPNTLPSTPDNPYNLHDGDPIVSQINPTSPEDDLRSIINHIADRGSEEAVGPEGRQYRQQAVQDAIRMGLDILEGRPVANRAYSGLPLLHYTGPEKVKTVQPIKDENGKVIGGNVDVHQVWFGQRIESDTGFLDVSLVQDVPWTVTYTVDVLNRGRDDFSPFVMYLDNPSLAKPGGMAPPNVGMDQSFYNMDEGTRTVFKIKMTLGQYYNLVYTWGWRMHPPRVQVMENAHKKITYPGGTPPSCPGDYEGLTLPQIEQSVFCQPGDSGCTATRCKPGEARFAPDGQPTACEKAALYAISQIGELAPEKRMWRALLDARKAVDKGDLKGASEIARTRALPAYFDWLDRDELPAGVEPDPDSDITIFYVNNSIYGWLTDGAWGRWDQWEERPQTLKVTAINGDNFVHSYTIADFGGNRGWENQFKSSVKFAGSGCWFTFGRVHWSMPAGGPASPYICVPAAQDRDLGRHRIEVELNYDPSRRLRIYQFDPMHHDVAVFSFH
jgi:hypothetical protein